MTCFFEPENFDRELARELDLDFCRGEREERDACDAREEREIEREECEIELLFDRRDEFDLECFLNSFEPFAGDLPRPFKLDLALDLCLSLASFSYSFLISGFSLKRNSTTPPVLNFPWLLFTTSSNAMAISGLMSRLSNRSRLSERVGNTRDACTGAAIQGRPPTRRRNRSCTVSIRPRIGTLSSAVGLLHM